MLKITTEQKNKGIEIGRKLGQSKMWINEKGEYFTSENFALLSAGSNKDKIGMIEVTAEAVVEKTTATATAVELIAAIDAATELDAVVAILEAETAGKNRATVIAAADAKIDLLKLPE